MRLKDQIYSMIWCILIQIEVAKVLVPVEELTNPHHQKEEVSERRGATMRYRVPSSPCGDIWGLTGYLTQQLVNNVLLEAFRNDLR